MFVYSVSRVATSPGAARQSTLCSPARWEQSGTSCLEQPQNKRGKALVGWLLWSEMSWGGWRAQSWGKQRLTLPLLRVAGQHQGCAKVCSQNGFGNQGLWSMSLWGHAALMQAILVLLLNPAITVHDGHSEAA